MSAISVSVTIDKGHLVAACEPDAAKGRVIPEGSHLGQGGLRLDAGGTVLSLENGRPRRRGNVPGPGTGGSSPMHHQRRPLGGPSAFRLGVPQQLERLNPNASRDAFEALERQIPLTALDAAHVSPMDAEDVGEGLLAQAAGFAVGPEVAADSSLQVSLGHAENLPVRYLTVYRLISSVVKPDLRGWARLARPPGGPRRPLPAAPPATISQGATSAMRPMFRVILTALVALGVTFTADARGATLTAIEPPFAIDGTVRDVAVDGGKTYAVGLFDAQRKVTGSGLILDAGGSGEPNPASFPKVAGRISDVEPDGAGGWYVGGQFAGVGGLPRSNVAHIRSDGSVDPDFTPNPDGPVDALSLAGGRLYLGGLFTKVDGASRAGFAAVTTAGSLIDSFDPQLNSGPRVLVATADTVYASGPFNEEGAAGATSVVAVSATTGAATSFKVDLARPGESSGLVRSLSLVGGDLLIGGSFLTVNGQSRPLLARVNATTGALSSWNAQVEGTYGSGTDSVATLTPVGDRLYLGGQFKKVGGQDRPWVAAVSLSTGAVDSWQPSGYTFGSNYDGVTQIAVSGDRVFFAGTFSVGPVASRTARAVVAVSASSGELVSFDPGIRPSTNPPGAVSALAAQSGKLYVGGMFAGAGTPLSSQGDAIRLNTDGSRDATWTPPKPPSSNGWSWIAIGTDTVYLSEWSKLIAVDKATGAVKPSFSPPAGIAGPLTLAAGKLYVTRSNTIAELDPATGSQSSWSPTFTGPSGTQIIDTAADGSNLYVGGMFTAVDGTTRKGLARFELPSHTLAPAHTVEGWINSLIPFGRRLLVRGQLQNGSFADQRAGAQINLDTQAVSWWPADPSSAEPPSGSDVVFDDAPKIASWGGLVHQAAARDIATGKYLADTPLGTGGFGSINATDQTADLLAGNFLSVGTTVTGPLAKVSLADVSAPTNTARPAIAGTASVASVLSCSPGTWTGSPSLSYQWLRSGELIPGATNSTYAVTTDDANQAVSCRVTATNAGGSASATSPAVSIPVAAPPPSGDTPTQADPNPAASNTSQVQQPPTRPGGASSQPPVVTDTTAPTVQVPSTLRLTQLRRGFSIGLTGLKPGSRVTANLRLGSQVIATATSKVDSRGAARLTLKPRSKKVKRGKLAVRIDMVTSDGKQLRRTRTIRVS